LNLATNLVRLLFVFASANHNDSTRDFFCTKGQIYASTEVESFLKSFARGVVEVDRLPRNLTKPLPNLANVLRFLAQLFEFELH
jgi:hypothetical protein